MCLKIGMENTKEVPECDDLPIGVFELPGEPAIVINGVPQIAASDEGAEIVTINANGGGEGHENSVSGAANFFGNEVFGEWLEGRKVMKMFGDQYYNGTVTQFDKESGWYRVVYEDGDSEDLDWNELESVLCPLDISLPIRALALKVLEKNQRSVDSSGKSSTKAEGDNGSRRRRRKGKKD